MRKPIVAAVYAAACSLAACAGFIVANTTHSTVPENAAQHIDGSDEELFGLVDTAAVRPDRGQVPQARPQPGLHTPAPMDTTTPEDSETRPQGGESAAPAPEPEVAPAGSGQSGNAQAVPGRNSPVQPQRLPPRQEARPNPPPAPVPEPPVIPDIPFPTLTINQLPVNPPKPAPLRPLHFG